MQSRSTIVHCTLYLRTVLYFTDVVYKYKHIQTTQSTYCIYIHVSQGLSTTSISIDQFLVCVQFVATNTHRDYLLLLLLELQKQKIEDRSRSRRQKIEDRSRSRQTSYRKEESIYLLSIIKNLANRKTTKETNESKSNQAIHGKFSSNC